MAMILNRIGSSLFGMDRLITIPRIVVWLPIIYQHINSTWIEPQLLAFVQLLAMIMIFAECYGSDFAGMRNLDDYETMPLYQKLGIAFFAMAFVMLYFELWAQALIDSMDYIIEKIRSFKKPDIS